MVYWTPTEFGVKLARAYNDARSAACAAHPKRFVGFAVLAL